MKTILVQAGCCLLACLTASATVRYVDLNNSNPAAPYTSWATAATTIQAAVDAATPGDQVMVTNGVYATGGRAVHGTMTNRVAVDKAVHLLSVNGPQFTVIQGYQVPGITNGDGAIRCVYLTNGASLSGFTLTNGATRTLGDSKLERSGGGLYGESASALVSNCVISGNCASGGGGGVIFATLYDCVLNGNSAAAGGGAANAWLSRCRIVGNSADAGGGAGVYNAWGGGPPSCVLENSVLVANSASRGGGASGCRLTNCTITGNAAQVEGGGVYGAGVAHAWYPSLLQNCIVYHNSAPAGANYNDLYCEFNSSCTTPLPAWGSANLTGDPMFVGFVNGDYRLQPGSPCINSGNNALAAGTTDLAGNPRIRGSAVDMGAFEFQKAAHYVDLNSLNPVSPYLNWGTAATNIQDAIDASAPGDEIIVTNGVYATGGRAVHGTMTNRVVVDKPLALRSVNGPQFTIIQGYQVPGTTNGNGAVRCVYLTNGASLFGFTLTNGATLMGESYPPAEEVGGGGVFCESTNAIVSDCLIIGNSARAGGGAYSGTLQRCELRNNTALGVCCDVVGGGGAVSANLNHCTVIGNSSVSGGGGTLYGTLNNCLILSNSLHGTYGGILNNCTIIGNSGTGAYGYYAGHSGIRSTLNNCVLYYNQPENWNSWDGLVSYSMSNCCTIPELIPPHPIFPPLSGNITNAPLFVDPAAGNWRLQSNSACINAGNNASVGASTDLDGRPRIIGGTVDMGAYEFQPDASGQFIGWLQNYGLATDGSADAIDHDNDRMNNWQEWRAGTIPTNPVSLLKLGEVAPGAPGRNVTWQSVAGRSYFLERATNLSSQPAFALLATNIPGLPGTTTFPDPSAVGSGPFFYRVGVQP